MNWIFKALVRMLEKYFSLSPELPFSLQGCGSAQGAVLPWMGLNCIRRSNTRKQTLPMPLGLTPWFLNFLMVWESRLVLVGTGDRARQQCHPQDRTAADFNLFAASSSPWEGTPQSPAPQASVQLQTTSSFQPWNWKWFPITFCTQRLGKPCKGLRKTPCTPPPPETCATCRYV